MLVSLIKLARPVQWLKNLIILAALVFAGVADSIARVETALITLAIFCLLSSAIYTLNDLVDRKRDREHPLKKERPIAAGKVSTAAASAMIVCLLIAGLTGASLISLDLLIVCIIFVLFNGLYSLLLKNIVILDVMAIALSFVIRAYAGAIAIDVPASKWLMINTLFLALFLGFGKRRHELILLEEKAGSHRAILERYSPYLLDQLIGIVTASVVVMYMLYSFSAEVSQKLGTENLFLTVPFVVYGVFRYLYLIHKEEKGGSPTKILIGDMPILINVILWIITVMIVLYVV